MRSAKACLTREELRTCDLCSPYNEGSRGVKYPTAQTGCNLMLLGLSSSSVIYRSANCKFYCSVKRHATLPGLLHKEGRITSVPANARLIR